MSRHTRRLYRPIKHVEYSANVLVPHREYGRKSPYQRAIEGRGRATSLCPRARQRIAPKRKTAILVVGDEEAVRALRRDLLSELGFDVMEISAGKHVIRRILPNVGNVGQLPRSGTALRR
jgi:hypothetical protein